MRAKLIAALALALPAAAAAQQVATVEFTAAPGHAVAGSAVKFTAIAKDAAGKPLPAAGIFYAAAPFDVAAADRDGTVRVFRQGTVRVLAIAGGKVAETTLTVAPQPPASVDVELAGDRVAVGGTTLVRGVARTPNGEPLRDARIAFRSSDERIASVDAAGMVTGRAPGSARIIASTSGGASGEATVHVVAMQVARIEVAGETSARTGDVVRFTARALDGAGRPIADAPVRWSVSGSGAAEIHPDGALVVETPGAYIVQAAVGPTAGTAAISVVPRTHARRLERVANLPFRDVQVAEAWAVGDALYVSSVGDKLYTFDIRDPAAPVLVDSLKVDAHHVNDVSTTPDGRIGVITRENASSRRNGIVFLDLSEPLRPKVLSEYTETVTGGVHSAFIDGHYVYLTDDATGSMRVIDFRDPRSPREVARWQTEVRKGIAPYRDPATNELVGSNIGRYLHDLQVKDGLAYLAYWNDGLIILDVGAGIRGGSPEKPVEVARFMYNVADFYPADRIAGTHTAFRYGNYLFVGDEVFPAVFDMSSRDRVEALGIIHVLDVRDVTRPRKVAEYRMPGGAHNVWAEEDVLYVGAYEGGLRALDISGELRGDLAAQGREIGAVWTGSPDGYRPNLPFAWGAMPHNGHIFTSDMNSGVWVARLTRPVVP